jgi:hypothetical protein
MTRILHAEVKSGERLVATDITDLTFFPKGTILMYDSQLWDRSGGIPGWHICDGTSGTINLTDKFICGGTQARQAGGTNTAQVPYHNHSFKGDTATGSLEHLTAWALFPAQNPKGVFSGEQAGGGTTIGSSGSVTGRGMLTLYFSMTPSGTVEYAGSNTADNRPAFCTVIFIEKIA